MTFALADAPLVLALAARTRRASPSTLSAGERVDALMGLASSMQNLREGEIKSLACSSGLSLEATRWAIRSTFADMTAQHLISWLNEAELPGHRARPIGLLGVVLSGNVLTSPARTLLLPLLMGVPVLARVSSREQLFASLRRSGVLQSQRGVRGGYSFRRDPSEVTILDVVETVDGRLGPVDDGGRGCDRVWTDARDTVVESLANLTIADMAEREARLSDAPMFHI